MADPQAGGALALAGARELDVGVADVAICYVRSDAVAEEGRVKRGLDAPVIGGPEIHGDHPAPAMDARERGLGGVAAGADCGGEGLIVVLGVEPRAELELDLLAAFAAGAIG